MRVFLDANVLFSASLLTRGNAPTLLRIGRTGGCLLLASSLALEEAERNLAGKAPGALARFPPVRRAAQTIVDPPADLVLWAEAQGLPAKDAPILAAAVGARADLLVTGDRRQFGPLFGRVLRGMRVLSLAEGLAAVLAGVDRERR
jgi:uncharacterized protein